MSETQIDRSELWSLSHYTYGEAYFGSLSGMRYRVAQDPLKAEKKLSNEERASRKLKVSVWPEPYAYAKTDKELIMDEFFPFTDEGLDGVANFLNIEYAKRFADKS